MNKAYLLTGGNLGNREHNLERAMDLIRERCGAVITSSALYETAPWGKTDQPGFLNQALVVKTRLRASRLLETLLQIENEIGRIREEKFGPRVIDIDILFYDDVIMRTDALTLPHPELTKRRFALTPLAEIAGDKLHPALKKTVSRLLEECDDQLPVVVFHP